MHPRELEAWLVCSLAWFCVWVVVRGLIGAGGCNFSRSASGACLLALFAPRQDITFPDKAHRERKTGANTLSGFGRDQMAEATALTEGGRGALHSLC